MRVPSTHSMQNSSQNLLRGKYMSAISIAEPDKEQKQKLEKSQEDFIELTERIKPFLKKSKILRKTSKSEWHFNNY